MVLRASPKPKAGKSAINCHTDSYKQPLPDTASPEEIGLSRQTRCKRDALPLSYSRVDGKRVTANPVPARETPVAGMPGDSKINPDLSGTALAGRPEV
jgi:hypothetical protein